MIYVDSISIKLVGGGEGECIERNMAMSRDEEFFPKFIFKPAQWPKSHHFKIWSYFSNQEELHKNMEMMNN